MTGRKRITVITNIILAVIITAVISVSFIGEEPLPAYGGKEAEAIYNGNRAGGGVSLMINVYENTEVVEAMVETLNAFGARATFFVGGCWADDNAAALKKIAESGHELANHGYFNKDHKSLGHEENKQEIELTGAVVEALSGVKPRLFAPPSGSFGRNTLNAAYDLGYKVIMWSKDTIDWRDESESKIISRATDNLTGGDLILMHPKPHTLRCLPEIIARILSGGYSLVTVSENIGDTAA